MQQVQEPLQQTRRQNLPNHFEPKKHQTTTLNQFWIVEIAALVVCGLSPGPQQQRQHRETERRQLRETESMIFVMGFNLSQMER